MTMSSLSPTMGDRKSTWMMTRLDCDVQQLLWYSVQLTAGLLDPADWNASTRYELAISFRDTQHVMSLRYSKNVSNTTAPVGGISAQSWNLHFKSTSSILASICCLLALSPTLFHQVKHHAGRPHNVPQYLASTSLLSLHYSPSLEAASHLVNASLTT